jgi:AAT family amino acid transporter
LTTSRLVLLTLGGIMGSGLFLASGLDIRRSGLSVLLVFAIGALAMTFEIWALAEMSAADPVPGSFLVYAERAYGRGMTFVTGWIFWFSSVLTMSSEVTAAGLFTGLFVPAVPLWVWSLGYGAVVVLVNFVSVRGFGTVEGVMAGVKVGAVLAFLAAVAWAVGSGTAGSPALARWGAVPLWPHGWTGPASTIILVLFAYAGTGIIGLAAAETARPGPTLSRTLALSIPLVWILYLGSIAAILLLVPWSAASAAASPFVQALVRLHVPWAARAMDIVLIFAVLSTMNAALYSNSRVLYALGRDGLAPRPLGRLNPAGIPAAGIWWSAGLLVMTTALAYFLPRQAYAELVTATGFQAMFIWGVILVTHLRHRAAAKPRSEPGPRVPGYPWTTYGTLGLVAGAMVLAPLAAAERIGLAISVGFIVLVLALYLLLRHDLHGH